MNYRAGINQMANFFPRILFLFIQFCLLFTESSESCNFLDLFRGDIVWCEINHKGNKCDLQSKRVVSYDEAKELADQLGIYIYLGSTLTKV